MSAIGTEGIFTVGVTLGTNWDVPMDLEKLLMIEGDNDNKMKNVLANRRDRRSLYPKIEYFFQQIGVDDWKDYVGTLLCRAKYKQPNNTNSSFVDEIERVIFEYPPLPASFSEPIDQYDHLIIQCADKRKRKAA